MLILIFRAVLLFLAITFTGITVTMVGGWCSMIASLDPEKQADIFGRVKYSFSGTWLWFVVGLLWTGFFFLGML